MLFDDRTDPKALVRRLVALVQGLEGPVTCACRRVYRVGTSSEIKSVCEALIALDDMRPEVPETSRFALLEVDQ